MTAILLDDVSFAYRAGRPLLANVNLHFEVSTASDRGRIVAVMGRSGSGKSTLLRLVAGVERPTQGSVRLDPEETVVSYLTQEPVLFEHLSRLENARYFQQVKNLRARFHEDVFERMVHLLKLEDAISASGPVWEMSGGERQRLALLRALSVRPGVLLLDEPCTGLDAAVKQDFLRVLREVADESRLIALYVTHHSEEAELAADEIVYLDRSESGRPARVARRELADFLLRPPTLEGAQAFTRLGWNLLHCFVEAGGAVRIAGGEIVGRCLKPTSAGDYLFLLAPHVIRWTHGQGQRVVQSGRSAEFVFARIEGHAAEGTVIGPATSDAPAAFVLSGTATVFSAEEGAGERISIEFEAV